MLTLTTLSAPAAIVSLSELKAHLRIASNVEDSVLTLSIAAASNQLERETGYVGTAGDYSLEMDLPEDRIIHLPRWPVADVTSVVTDVGAVVGAVENFAARRITLPSGTTGETVTVLFSAGLEESSDPGAKLAVLHLAAHFYWNRGGSEKPVPLPSWWGRMTSSLRGSYSVREQN